MADAPQITRVNIPGSNYQNGRAAKIDQITFHHIVGDAAGALARFKKLGEQVSSTYIIGSDGRIYQCVDEADTPYTDTNFNSNSRAITIEHAGGIDGVPYTDAMYAASAQLVAWIRSRYNITRFMRHRDVAQKPTACPGKLDVERIIKASERTADMPSKVDRDIAGRLLTAYFTPEQIEAEGGETFIQSWAGTETNAMIKALDESPQFRNKRLDAEHNAVVLARLKKQPVGNGLYTEADRARDTETNSIIKQIWQKITNVFK